MKLILFFIGTMLLGAVIGSLPIPSANAAPIAPGASTAARPLPSVLGADDVAIYQQLFALASASPRDSANGLVLQLRDPLLMGHVLARRYLDPRGGASPDELAAWLERWSDLPQADRIAAQLNGGSPVSVDGFAGLWSYLRPTPPERRVMPERDLDPTDRVRADRLKRDISAAIKAGDLRVAVAVLDTGEAAMLLSDAEVDQLRTRVAQAALRAGDDELAAQQGGPAAERSGNLIPDADWLAGLANWRLGNFKTAAAQFERMAQRTDLGSWPTSGAAFWAARANLFAQQPARVAPWLERAGEFRHTFYGLLAQRIQGKPIAYQWTMNASDAAAIANFAQAPAGRRTLALIEVGEIDGATKELRGIVAGDDVALAHGAMIVAESAGLCEMAFKIQRIVRNFNIEYPPASYPLPSWSPEGGFSTDPALIYALIRQESAFNPQAVSSAGARGLMQLMPGTARFVVQRSGLGDPNSLSDPTTNMTLGQRYIEMLLSYDSVGSDLFRLAAAWNGGPGNLNKWSREARHFDDPLLFIEVLPASETRDFIERVLANLWIYRHRMGRPSPSLDALAAGQWPGFDGWAGGPIDMAAHGEPN